jgi:hypothetical protein
LTATVAPVGGSGVPTGLVSFIFGTTTLGQAQLVASGSVATATITAYASQFTAGNDTVVASYSGNLSFNGSVGTVSVTVSVPTNASAVVPSMVPNPVYEEAADSDGYSWFFTIDLTEVVGVGTTLTGLNIDGTDYSSDIVDFFGSAAIPPDGTLSADLRSKGLTVPVNRVFAFSGVDASGRTWTQQITVPFMVRR